MQKLPWGLVVVFGWVAMVIAVYMLFATLSLVMPKVDLDSEMAMNLLIPVALTGAIAIVVTIIRKLPVLASSHRLCVWGLLFGPVVFLLVTRFLV